MDSTLIPRRRTIARLHPGIIGDWKAGSPQQQTFTYDGENRLITALAVGGTGGTYTLENYLYSAEAGLLTSKAGVGYAYSPTAHPHAAMGMNKTGGANKTVTVRAKGTSAQGVWPIMKLWVNGVERATWTVNSTSYANYTVSVPISGADRVDVQFTNDLSAPPEDRNLYVDYVKVNTITRHPETGAAVLDRGDGSLAFDGLDVLAGQELLAWNGSLRFVFGAGGYTAGYDANGNMTYKVKDNQGLVLVYDAENRLMGVSGSATASFVYDGDGKRVKGTVAGVTTTYVGDYLEWKTGPLDMQVYYYAGGTRVAMRKGTDAPNWLLGDHLGSTAITASSAGGKLAEVRYKAWGEDRYTSGSTPTTFRFTGQRQESGIGLYFYNARWYDSSLGRFAQADTIVPQPGNALAWDRYAYTLNNPVRYTDPSGYYIEEGAGYVAPERRRLLFTNGFNYDERVTFENAAQDVAIAYARDYNQSYSSFAKKWGDDFDPLSPSEAFLLVHDGPITIKKLGYACDSGCWGEAKSQNLIQIYSEASTRDIVNNPRFLIHEIGHSFEKALTQNGLPNLRGSMPGAVVNGSGFLPRHLGWQYRLEGDNSAGEIFADMFIHWAYVTWPTRPAYSPLDVDAASSKASFMQQHMVSGIALALP